MGKGKNWSGKGAIVGTQVFLLPHLQVVPKGWLTMPSMEAVHKLGLKMMESPKWQQATGKNTNPFTALIFWLMCVMGSDVQQGKSGDKPSWYLVEKGLPTKV